MASELPKSGPRHVAQLPKAPEGDRQVKIPLSQLGPPGISEELHLTGSLTKQSEEEGKARIEDATPRQFTVVCRLGKTPLPVDSTSHHWSMDPLDGDSLLTGPGDYDVAETTTPFGMVSMYRNKTGGISGLEVKCEAKSRGEALARFSKAAMPVLDHLSYQADVPVYVLSYSWMDDANKVYGGTYTAPFQKTAAPEEGNFNPAMIPIYALYREALCSSSPFYAFLCYAKILEGIFGHLRHELQESAKKKGIRLQRVDERVPKHEKLRNCPWVGDSIQQTFEQHLKPDFRTAVAHFTKHNEEPIVLSNYLTAGSYTRHLFLLRLCCRRMIEAFENYYAQI